MARLLAPAVVLLTIAGCAGGGDPCDGRKGVCVSLRVEGTVSGLDQLLVTLDKPALKSQRTPVPAAAFTLPVQVALVLPAGTAGSVNVTVDGVGKGKVLARAANMVTLVGGHGSVKVTLKTGTVTCMAPCDAPMQCEPTSGSCVRCLADADCTTGEYCDTRPGAFACKAGCRVTSDCQGMSGTPACCGHTCVDLSADVNNCGACQTACAPAHATAKCESGCKVASCDTGFSNCNADDSDGCEANTATDPMHCGACGTACTGANVGMTTCTGGVCGYTACQPGFADCDSDPTNGCEVHTDADPMHCGACGTVCTELNVGMTSCTGGVCGFVTCQPGFADCDSNPSNGCEHAVTNLAECGACGRPCAPANVAGLSCSASGVCDYTTCVAPFVDADGVRANGCEANSDTDPMNCGGLGRVCSSSGTAMVKCTGGKCTSTCQGGLGNCTQPAYPVPDDGCETNLSTNVNHCGDCARPCSGTQVAGKLCAGGKCTSTCNATFANCSRPPSPAPDDGCECSGACSSAGRCLPPGCVETASPSIAICISNNTINNYTTAGQCMACTEKGLTNACVDLTSCITWFTNTIVETLYNIRTGSTCTAAVNQSGSCGWFEVSTVTVPCPTPQDCTSGINWQNCTFGTGTNVAYMYGVCNLP